MKDPTGRSPSLASERCCDLTHQRSTKAVIRMQVKSSRWGSPGRAMFRDLNICAAHAREFGKLGIDLVGQG